MGERGKARCVAGEKRKQLPPLMLRTVLRQRLHETERRRDRDGDRGVAARQFLEHEGVQHGRLFERSGLGVGDRLDKAERPGGGQERRRQRRCFVRRPR